MSPDQPKPELKVNFLQRYLLNRKIKGVEESLSVRIKKFQEMAVRHTWDQEAERYFNYCISYFHRAKDTKKNYEILKPALEEYRKSIYDALHGNSYYTEDEFQQKMKKIPQID